MYIDGKAKALGNVAWLIYNTWHRKKRKKLDCIFEGCEVNKVFVCVVKTTVAGEELLMDYDLNRIDTCAIIMGVVMFYYYFQPLINDSFFNINFNIDIFSFHKPISLENMIINIHL